MTMYSGDEFYGDDVTSGVDMEEPATEPEPEIIPTPLVDEEDEEVELPVEDEEEEVEFEDDEKE